MKMDYKHIMKAMRVVSYTLKLSILRPFSDLIVTGYYK